MHDNSAWYANSFDPASLRSALPSPSATLVLSFLFPFFLNCKIVAQRTAAKLFGISVLSCPNFPGTHLVSRPRVGFRRKAFSLRLDKWTPVQNNARDSVIGMTSVAWRKERSLLLDIDRKKLGNNDRSSPRRMGTGCEIDQNVNPEQACARWPSDWKFRNSRNIRVVEICDPIRIHVYEDRLGQTMGP